MKKSKNLTILCPIFRIVVAHFVWLLWGRIVQFFRQILGGKEYE
jgi:hypothetical protein